MAATLLPTAAPAWPWCQRPTSGITQSRLCFLPLPKPSSASSPSSLCSSTVHSTPRRRLLVVSCLPSSPGRGRTVANKLYVSGLSFRTTEESLRNAFENFGQLVEVNLVMDRIANRPRGFAFLRYETEEESKRAIEGMHGKFLDGRVIFVEPAKPRSELRQNNQAPRL